ncbi:acyl-CoA dehydrogenase domain-containing protein [Mycolicibacterium rhodesiae JS60]|nr:acyl-CoA dehydrogenase domain-containing protein [Mycolicibacterium rhodesiae JS60]
MDFRYTPDQVEVIRYARESLRAHLPLARLSAGDAAVGPWAAIGHDGWLHVCLADDEAQPDLALVAGIAREAGAVAAGEEFVQNGWLIPRLCAAIDPADRSAEWLAAQQETPGYLPDSDAELTFGAHPGFDRYELEQSAGEWQRLHRSRNGDTSVAALAGLSVSIAGVISSGGELADATLHATPDYVQLTLVGTRILRAAAAVGLAVEILDRTVTYVGERHQFGRPIGQFQAVKHLCADLLAELEVAWLAVQYATVSWQSDALAVEQAANQAAQVALSAARTGAQLHGGMGFTWECELHWLLKAALDTQLILGPPATSASTIGAALLETA